MKQSDMKGHLAAFVTIFIWGTTFISTKVLLKSLSPIEILFIRFLIGYATLWLVYPHQLKPAEKKQELCFAAAGLCGVTLYYLMENMALTYTLASNVGVIISIAPFFTAIFSFFLRKGDKPGKRFFLGFVMAMAGICLISGSSGAALSLNPLGDVLAIGAAIIWAVYSLLTRKIGDFGYHVVQATRRTFFYGILFMVPALAFMDFRMTPVQFTDMKNILNLLFLGLGASALCFVTWNTGVKILGAVKTSIYIYMVPVITTLTSALILKEPVTVPAALGIIMTLAGLFLSEQKTTGKGEPKIWTTKMKNV